MSEHNGTQRDEATFTVKAGLAEMLKGGVIMDVMNVEQARIAEEAGAISGMALERGPEADARRFIDAARAEMTERGEGAGLSFMDWAESVLYNGLGRYPEALVAARRVVGHTELVPVGWTMPELVEAAVRAGARELAAETDRRLTERSRASGTNWALGIAARSHALLADGGRAEALYAEAIERLYGEAETHVADLARHSVQAVPEIAPQLAIDRAVHAAASARAQFAFEEALRQSPGLERALAGAGGLAQMLGRNGPAESYWRQAVQANPWLPAYRRNLTLLLRQKQSWAEARRHSRAWMELDQESSEARCGWITCLLQAGDQAEAGRSIRRDAAVLDLAG